MSRQVPTSDAQLLDLLRIAGPLSVSELTHAMEVTATAVRQRLARILGQKAIHARRPVTVVDARETSTRLPRRVCGEQIPTFSIRH